MPDLFELSEYDFEELCEELVRPLEGVTRATPKNRRGNPQFGVDVEGYSVRQKPFVVLSAKRERGPTKAKLRRWSNDFLKHIDGHWRDKGVERFVLACADEFRGDQVNGQITDESETFRSHGMIYDPWDCKDIVRQLRSRRDLVELFLHPAWVERICGLGVAAPSPPLAGATGQRSGAVAGAAPNMAKLAALAERLADSTRRELELAMSEARRWRTGALDGVLDRIRADAVQWDALPDRDKARVLRLAAARALSRNDCPTARQLASDAAAFHESDDRTLEALILRCEERALDALHLLADPQTDPERHARAGLLIELGRAVDAKELLGSGDPETANPPDSETLRLTMLSWLVLREPQTALRIRARARPPAVGDDAGLAWAEAVTHFNAALANGTLPDLGAFPNPIDRSLFREDTASLRHLDEAARRFSELAASVDGSDRQDLEVWLLAAVSSNPTRGEEAEALSRDLVSRANPHPGAVAWALARGYEVNAAKVRRSFRDLIAAGRGTASHLAVLAGLELSLGQASKAERLLDKERARFSGVNDRALIDFWLAQIGHAKAGGDARPSISPTLDDHLAEALAGNEEAAVRLGQDLTDGGSDSRTVTQVAEVLAKAGRHAAVSKLAPQLLGLGTARGISLVAHAAYFLGDWREAVATLRDRTQAFAGGRLPLPLMRLQIDAAFRLGDAGGALAYARAAAVAFGEEDAETMRDLAALHHQIGDVRGIAAQLRRLPGMETLPARDAIVFARDIRRHDPDLARQLLQHAGRDLEDPGVVAEGMRLALDLRDDLLAGEVFGPAFQRLAEAGDTQSVVRVVNAEQAAVAMRDASQNFERAFALWRNADIPMHVAFGGQRPEVIALLFDEQRDLNSGSMEPLLVRPGRSHEEEDEVNSSDGWSLTMDLTALLLAEALDLLDAVTRATEQVLLPSSVPEALRLLEDALRPDQPFMRNAEETVHAAVREGRIATLSEQDPGEVQIVREQGDPVDGPSFSDMAATLRDRCGIHEARIDSMLGRGASAGDPTRLEPGAVVQVNIGRLVQLQTADMLDTAIHCFQLAVRRADAEGFGRMVEGNRRAEASAERIARLRERVADYLTRQLWSMLPQSARGLDEAAGSIPEHCLREFLSGSVVDAIDDRHVRIAWTEDRFLSGFRSIENRATIVTVVEVLAFLRRREVLPAIDMDQARAKLRRLGYAFLPFEEDEIPAALAAAPLEGNRLVETEALATIRRHLALQIEALAHAAFSPSFQRPDGRVDDSGIMAHILGLYRRTLPTIWARFPTDRRRRYAAADWILSNLRVETVAVGPLAERATEILERFRLQSCAWLVVQAALIPISSAVMEPGDASQWEAWPRLVGDYVRFALAKVIEPLAEMQESNADAIAASLAQWAISASELIPGDPDDAEEQRAQRVWLVRIKLVLAELPVAWLSRLESQRGFVDRFGSFVVRRMEIEQFVWSPDQFWHAAERAFAGEDARFMLEEPATEAVVRRRERDAGPTSIVVEAQGAEVDLRDPAFVLAHHDEGIRRLTLETDMDWLEGLPERRLGVIAAIAGEQNVLRRMGAFEDARNASIVWRLRKIGSSIRNRTEMDWTLLEPPSPANVRDHLRMNADHNRSSLVEAAREAADRLLEELPVEFSAARLAGLIVPLPDSLLASLAGWMESEPVRMAERFQFFASTPLRARLAARALLLHGSTSATAEGVFLAQLADALEDGSTLFRAVLRWVVRTTSRRSDWRALEDDERATLSWAYADLLTSSLLAAEIDRDASAQIFDERHGLNPRDLQWQLDRPASLAERSELIATRAIDGVLLADVLTHMRADVVLSVETKQRLRALCTSASGPYAAPELFVLGRLGWSWLDADPLPILSRFFDDFGPGNLTSIDRRGRAEIVGRELAGNIESDVAGLLLTVTGADALDRETAVNLLNRLRDEVTTDMIAGQETLGSLRTEAALVLASGIDATPTIARLREIATLLGNRHRGGVMVEGTQQAIGTPVDLLMHSLHEVVWTLADATAERDAGNRNPRFLAFADLAATLAECWPEVRFGLASLLDALTAALPIDVIRKMQPHLERIRMC